MTSPWPQSVVEILAGDQAVMLASVTPAHGVVLSPVTNFGTHDPDTGVVSVNTSIGAWKKIRRIRENPQVALAFHTREHGHADRPEYVLLQGTATLSPPQEDFPDTIADQWERFNGPVGGRLWRRWLRVYYTRVSIDITVRRAVVWPGLDAAGSPEVYGDPLPDRQPAPQRPPARGTAPRLDAARAAATLTALPNLLLGWEDADGFPMVVPTRIEHGDDRGIRLRAAHALPPGARRAGLTGHAFTRHVIGQRQRVHTGWLEIDDGRGTYAPHTAYGYRMPASTTVYRLAVGFFTRYGARSGRRQAHPDRHTAGTPRR